MKEGDPYCGFDCAEIKERQQAILDDIMEFSEQSPEFALVMLGKIIEMAYNVRMTLPAIKNANK